jgi:hypothetical protein
VVSEVVIRALSPGEVCAAELLLGAELGGRHQVRLGEVHDVLARAGYGGWDSDRLVGIAPYALVGDRAAVAALAEPPPTGSAVVSVAVWWRWLPPPRQARSR